MEGNSPAPRTRLVQRLMCMCLLIGGLDVSLANAHLERYVPFTHAWIAATVIIGATFIVQTVRERRRLDAVK